MLREIYGCIESVLLLYKLLSAMIDVWDFKINHYDRYVANKVIEGTQCNIGWYVYDKNILHRNPEVVSDIINEMKKHSGEIYAVRGNNSNLLGVNK